jgi:hypothetical protein
VLKVAGNSDRKGSRKRNAGGRSASNSSKEPLARDASKAAQKIDPVLDQAAERHGERGHAELLAGISSPTPGKTYLVFFDWHREEDPPNASENYESNRLLGQKKGTEQSHHPDRDKHAQAYSPAGGTKNFYPDFKKNPFRMDQLIEVENSKFRKNLRDHYNEIGKLLRERLCSGEVIQSNECRQIPDVFLYIGKERGPASSEAFSDDLIQALSSHPHRHFESMSFSSLSASDILDVLEFSTAPVEVIVETEEGQLQREKDDQDRNLTAYFESQNVPKSEWPILAQKLKIEIARVTRPKWIGRLERGGKLATVSAPLFLKHVHADFIAKDGTVENEVIRAIDPDLMRAVESYVANRKARMASDMGDAENLKFVLLHPGKGSPKGKADKFEL